MVVKDTDVTSDVAVQTPDPSLLTTSNLLREIANLKDIIFTRMAAYDRAILVLQEYANNRPTIGEVVAKTDERFLASKELLTELDKRYNSEFAKISTTSQMMVEQQALALTATKDAVSIAMAASEKAVAKAELAAEQREMNSSRAADSALIAAKEAVRIQQDFNDKAIQKQEAVFTKQIDQIYNQIQTMAKGFDDKIDDLKNRVISVESGKLGGKDTWTWVAVLGFGLLAALFVIFKSGGI